MDGNIFVKGEPGVGACFWVELPALQLEKPSDNIHNPKSGTKLLANESSSSISVMDNNSYNKNASILIVEDNEDLNEFLSIILKDKFKVYRAFNGKEGYKKAIKTMPDLIISDVMMPKMNGVELCSTIKTNKLTCHIPFIILTVKSNEKSQLEGLSSGADDYIFKPFNPTILQRKVDNLLRLKEKIRQNFTDRLFIDNKSKREPEQDPLLKNILTFVEEHLSDTELSIDLLTKEVGVGRSQLFMKVKKITGLTVNELIMNVRLKKAFYLISEGNYNVSEVAYLVGFKNISHFTKSFKMRFGKVPSVFMQR